MRASEKYFSEFLGTLILLLSIVGSGIMGQNLSQNEGVILLANSLAIGFTLTFLIITFGKRSGAHFNPAVSIARTLTDTFTGIHYSSIIPFVLSQFLGAITALIVLKRIYKI
jgi:glycerol uptake facilitator-like aquaporin